MDELCMMQSWHHFMYTYIYHNFYVVLNDGYQSGDHIFECIYFLLVGRILSHGPVI